MIRNTFILFLLFILSQSHAQTSSKEITDAFFVKYQKDQMQAIDFAFSTSKYINTKSESIIDLKNKLKNLIELCGDYKGYELITEVALGQSLKSASYIIKYDRQPIRFLFSFYKPDDKWVVQDFSFDTDLDTDIESAMKEKTISMIK